MERVDGENGGRGVCVGGEGEGGGGLGSVVVECVSVAVCTHSSCPLY